MSEILSREEWATWFGGVRGGEPVIVTQDEALRVGDTIQALATVLNAHPENPTELTAHEELVDMLREKGWIE